MPFYAQIKHTETISAQAVSTALHLNCLRLEPSNDLPHDRLKSSQESFIVYSIVKGKVHGVVLSLFASYVFNAASTRKVISKFVKRCSHHPVSRKKCLLDTVSVMAVYVNIQNSLISL